MSKWKKVKAEDMSDYHIGKPGHLDLGDPRQLANTKIITDVEHTQTDATVRYGDTADTVGYGVEDYMWFMVDVSEDME